MPMRPLKGRKFADRTTALVVQAAADELAADGIEAPREAMHHYLPPTKGDLAEALADPRAMTAVAPETPRPAEMLESVVVKGDEALTGKDLALHELLVATAYETLLTSARAGYPTDVLGREMEMPMRTILAYLGPSARRSHVQRSLTALRAATVSYGLTGGRRFTNVPLLVGWGEEDDTADVVRFSLPSPVWALMAAQPRYAYLELAAMAGMRTRYGIKLYRRLALHMSRQPDWTEQTSATLVELTPEEAAAWVGYVEAPLHVGHLQTALKRAVADLDTVKRFSVQWMPPRRGHGRGAPVERFVLSVLLSPPTRHQVPAAKVTDTMIKHVGGVDAPEFRVNQHVWLKAQTLATRMKISSFATWISEAWLIALNEALTSARYSDHGYRAFRGARLLQALRDRPADDVAWDWALEELSDPDLTVLDQNPALTGAERAHIVAEAHKARYHRYRDHAEGTGRERRIDPIKEALKAERRAARVEKQRREKADADAARIEATRDRRERFLTADIARFEVDSLDRVAAYENRLAAERSMERTWTGERYVEIQIWHRVGGQFQTDCLGHYPASIADLEAIETEPDSVLKRFRPLQREARVFDGGRPSFMPKRQNPAASAAPVFAPAPPMDCAHLVDEDEEDDLSTYEGDYEVADDDCPF